MFRKPTLTGKESGTQMNSLEQKELKHIQPEQNEETTIQNIEESLRNLQDNFKWSNIQLIVVAKRKNKNWRNSLKSE